MPITGAEEEFSSAQGDVFFMWVFTWAQYGEFNPVFQEAREARANIVTAIYDLLPITLQKGNFVEGGMEWFTRWLDDAVESSDALVCISRAVAEDVKKYIGRRPQLGRRPKVGFWHLGSDL